MSILIADVGGTNTRIALSDASGRVHGISRYRNDEFQGFPGILTRFARDRPLPVLAGCCVAIAGPVTPQSARLTNRNWEFDSAEIAAALNLPDPGRVCLINDLAALGHALPMLGAEQLVDIRAVSYDDSGNGQALVAGLGTGFNVCVVKGGQGRSIVIEAELGHASLPDRVARMLKGRIGEAADSFDSIESLFSGQGLPRLFGILSGAGCRDGNAILAACEGDIVDGPARLTVNLMAELLGVFSRELVFQYLPFGGIHFAGSVARGILGSGARELFLAGLDAPGRFSDEVRRVPIRVIADDAAALTGAARYFADAGPRTG
jgi:glucokinase